MYTVGVIGLGAIAAGYGTPADAAPYCHVGGIRLSRKVRLVAAADMAPAPRQKFTETWGPAFPEVKLHENAATMLAEHRPDIVAVCVRGPHHLKVTSEVLAASPRAVFLEKPPTCSLEEMDQIFASAEARKIPITVSYSRHWAPHVLCMEELVREGLIGKVTSVVGYCGGTFLSYASHTTDLICQFAGYDAAAVYARGAAGTDPVPGGYEPEPTLSSMTIEFANGVIGTQLDAPGHRGVFTVDVYGTQGRINVGMYVAPEAFDKEGKSLDAQVSAPPRASVFTVAYDQIADHLDGGPLPACTGERWRRVHEIGFAAIESVLTGKRIELPNVNRARRIFANG